MKPYQFHLFSRRSLIVFSCLLFCSCILFGQEKNYYFFRPYDYGSDGLYNPITLFANGAFDSFQILDREPEWKNVYWNISTTNVWHSLTSPFPVISAFGWSRFLRQEIFPVGLRYRCGTMGTELRFALNLWRYGVQKNIRMV